jgi:anti-sigma-K factor RskA
MANGIQIAKTTMRLWRTEKRAIEESMGVLFGGKVASLGYETEHCDGYMAVPFR